MPGAPAGAANVKSASDGPAAGLQPGIALDSPAVRMGAAPQQGAAANAATDGAAVAAGLSLSGAALGAVSRAVSGAVSGHIAGDIAGAAAATPDTLQTTQVLFKATLQSAAVALSVGAQAAPEPEDNDTDAVAAHPDEAPAAQDAPDGAPDGDDYASRLLHVYRDADGVQAWLRDASVKAGQGAVLAQSMASELAVAGNRLTALTVNGKRVALPGYGAASADAPAAAAQTENFKINANGAA